MKPEDEIISTLMRDTKDKKFTWYADPKEEILYCKRRLVKDPSTNIKGNDKIDLIFKISDQLVEEEIDEDDYMFAEYQGFYPSRNLISLDISISKNNKKEIFCRRITSYQLKLTELLEIILEDYKLKPEK